MGIDKDGFFDRRAYFFDQGLKFECRQCGACCTGAPGTIYVSSSEIHAIAPSLNLTPVEFQRRYLYPYKNSFSIKEDEEGNCRFFTQGCAIYPMRPLQCRTFPFWFTNLRSEGRWMKIRAQCPGIGHGRRYSKEEIMAAVRLTMHL